MYKRAIFTNSVEDFLLGNGDYYIHNRDWDSHDYSASWFEIMLYSREENDNLAFSILDRTLVSMLNKNNNSEYFYLAIIYICNYLHYKLEDVKIFESWVFSSELKCYILKLLETEIELSQYQKDNFDWCCQKIKNEINLFY